VCLFAVEHGALLLQTEFGFSVKDAATSFRDVITRAYVRVCTGGGIPPPDCRRLLVFSMSLVYCVLDADSGRYADALIRYIGIMKTDGRDARGGEASTGCVHS